MSQPGAVPAGAGLALVRGDAAEVENAVPCRGGIPSRVESLRVYSAVDDPGPLPRDTEDGGGELRDREEPFEQRGQEPSPSATT
jgi:hypothetical protein